MLAETPQTAPPSCTAVAGAQPLHAIQPQEPAHQQQQQQHQQQHSDILCISFSGPDTCRVSTAPHQTVPSISRVDSIASQLHATIKSVWLGGVTRFTVNANGTMYEFKLGEAPWTLKDESRGSTLASIMQNDGGQMCVLAMMHCMNRNGWRLLVSVNASKATTAAMGETGRIPKDSLVYQWVGTMGHGEKMQTDASMYAISLVSTNVIRVLGLHRDGFDGDEDASQSVVQVLRQTIEAWWPRGLQSETPRPQSRSHEFKLHGYPWSMSLADAVDAPLLVHAIVEALYRDLGLELLTGVNVVGDSSDPSTPRPDLLIFRSVRGSSQTNVHSKVSSTLPHRPLQPLDSWHRVCIALCSSSSLRVISGPPSTEDKIKQCIKTSWPEGLHKIKVAQSRNESLHISDTITEGFPWWGDGNDAVHCRKLLLSIIAQMAHDGWRPASSLELNTCSHESRTLMFKPHTGVTQASLFAVAFARTTCLRMIPYNLDPANEHKIKEIVGDTLVEMLKSIKSVGTYAGAVEWTAHGSSWDELSPDVPLAIFFALITRFQSIGFELLSCTRVTTKQDQSDTLIFGRFNA